MNALLTNTVIQSHLMREKRLVAIEVAPVAAASKMTLAARKALLAEVAQFGFTLSGDLLSAIDNLVPAMQKSVVSRIVSMLREVSGASHTYVPLFRNFPVDVPNDDEYLLRRLVGFIESCIGPLGDDHTVLSCGHVVNHRLFDLESFGACPVCQMQVPELSGRADERKPLSARQEFSALKMLNLAREEDVWAAWANLAGAKTSLSAAQKEFLVAVASAKADECAAHLPSSMPFKENAAVVLAALFKAGVPADGLLPHVKTTTDALRVAVALCDGDVSLAEACKFKLRQSERKFVLAAFERVPHTPDQMSEEMLNWRERWLRLGHAVHVGEHAKRFPKAAACFDVLRNAAELLQSRGSRIEEVMSKASIDAKEGKSIVAMLSERPGDLARRLDALIRKGAPADVVTAAFDRSAGGVATPTLLTLVSHLRQRGDVQAFRSFMPKGSVAKMQIVADQRATLPVDVRLSLMKSAEAALLQRFSERAPLGRVFVDDSLANVIVPFSQRTASKGMSPMTRGSRVAFDSSKGFLRLFMNWKENEESGRVDIDLSASMYDDNWNGMGHLSWTCLSSFGRSVHSGDVQSGSGPHGAAEFIDLDLEAFRKRGVRYVAMSVYSFTGQQFAKLPCYAGFMERAEPSKGRQFEARTVKHRFEVTAAATTAIPMVADLQTNEILWADMMLKGRGRYNTIESSSDGVVATLQAIDQMGRNRMSLKDLFDLHVQARGEAVADAAEADLVIDGAKVMELDDVVANWL